MKLTDKHSGGGTSNKLNRYHPCRFQVISEFFNSAVDKFLKLYMPRVSS